MPAYEDYKDKLINALSDNSKTFSVSEQRELIEIIGNNIFGSGSLERYVSKTKFSKYLSFLYHGWIEIDRTYNNLKDIEIYIQRFPYKKTTINKINYIHYHIGNYLNEMYILENRLLDYPKKILRTNKNSPNFMEDKKLFLEFGQIVKSSFQKIVLVRGSHVHRYHFSDDDLERIQLLSLIPDNILKELSNSDDFFSILRQYQAQYLRETQHKWSNNIITNNLDTKKLLDAYFEFLNLIVFDKKGKVIFTE